MKSLRLAPHVQKYIFKKLYYLLWNLPAICQLLVGKWMTAFSLPSPTKLAVSLKLPQSQCLPEGAQNTTAHLSCERQWRNTFLTAQGNEALCCRFIWRDEDRSKKAIRDNLNGVRSFPWQLLTLNSLPWFFQPDLTLTMFLPETKA